MFAFKNIYGRNFLIIIFLVFMGLPVWGLLDKAQDDPTTIDEAITEAVTNHNDDPDAHLEVGQSLRSHRFDDILDHKVGSVVADKLSHQEAINETSFDSIDGWSTLGSVSLMEWPGVQLYFEYGAVSLSELYSTVVYPDNFLNYAKTLLFQCTAWETSDVANKAYLMLGAFNSDTNLEGFGFQIINGVVKGFWGKGTSPTFTVDLGIDVTLPHVYRAQYDPTAVNVEFYVDGQLLATIEDISVTVDFEPQIDFRVVPTAADDGYLRIQKLLISRGS